VIISAVVDGLQVLGEEGTAQLVAT